MSGADAGVERISRRGLTRLIVLNAVLLGVLGLVELAPRASAQQGEGPARPRGAYTLVGGEIQTGNSNAVYVIDSVNQEMVVLRVESGRGNLAGVGFRDLNADLTGRTRR
jgi:hypothetical protein